MAMFDHGVPARAAMNILAIDTCFGACSAAVGAGLGSPHARVEAYFERRSEGHAERLMPMIDAALDSAGFGAGDLDRVAVTLGPGTFTGARIGIAAARGLALAAGLPIAGVSSLAVMAQEAAEEIEDRGVAALVVAVDARRGEVYAQLFGRDGLDALSPPLLLTPGAAAALGRGPLLAVGSGGPRVAREARALGRAAAARLEGLQPDACTLLYMAEHLPPLAAPPRPLYLREPDAKPPETPSLTRS